MRWRGGRKQRSLRAIYSRAGALFDTLEWARTRLQQIYVYISYIIVHQGLKLVVFWVQANTWSSMLIIRDVIIVQEVDMLNKPSLL